MKLICIFLMVIFSLDTTAADQKKECFKFGEQWHDLALPNDMKNVRWLFGDDKDQTPFMSVSFNIDNKIFESWALDCGIDLKEITKHRYWAKDIEMSTTGSITVVKYKNDRFCIGIVRTIRSGEEKKVNGKPYFGCPIDGPIDY